MLFGSSRHRSWLTACLLGVAAFLLYAPTIGFGFDGFDTPSILLKHANLYDETSFFSSLNHILYEHFPREEPLILRDISWALDARIFGFKNPLGYHLGNVLLNALNVALVFVYLWVLTRRYGLALFVAIDRSRTRPGRRHGRGHIGMCCARAHRYS